MHFNLTQIQILFIYSERLSKKIKQKSMKKKMKYSEFSKLSSELKTRLIITENDYEMN